MDADEMLGRIERAGEALADAAEREAELEDYRAGEKSAAILRLMQGANPLTGKAHSASSAEAVVETDAEYAAYRARQRKATVATIHARVAYEVAKSRARLAAGVLS